MPFPTVSGYAEPTSIIESVAVATLLALPTLKISPVSSLSPNLFDAPFAGGAPPAQFAVRSDHPATPIGVISRTAPLSTNHFWTSFVLGDQSQTIWPQPYNLRWNRGQGDIPSWGLSIANTDRGDLVFGEPIQAGEPPRYFAAPLYTQSVIMSASELGTTTVLTTDSHQPFSITANLAMAPSTANLISFPIVQGMAFTSAIYSSATLLLQSGVNFTGLTQAGTVEEDSMYKWEITLKDGTSWLLYVTPNGAIGRPPLTLQDSNNIVGPSGFSGLVQVAKNNAGACGEQTFDAAAGTYPISAAISASVDVSC